MMVPVKFVVAILRGAVEKFPTKSVAIKYGDENSNRIPDITVTLEFDDGDPWIVGPFDVPVADLPTLLEAVAGLID